MADNTSNINVPREGMIEDLNKLNKTSTQYNYALNATVSEFTGENFVLQNEHSNVLETSFPKGFQVIGKKEIPEQDRVIFMLVNPETGESEIGESLKVSFKDMKDSFFVSCFSCTKEQFLEKTPLEQLDQKAYISYYPIIKAECLNFNIDYPIDIEYKISDTSLNLYFTDNLNQRRFIYFDYIDNDPYSYLTLQKEFKKITGYVNNDCSQPIYSEELDCNKISYHPCFKKPIFNFNEDLIAGNLKAGTYQIIISYSTEKGQPLTSYFNASNPIPLQNKSLTVNTDYDTGLGFSFDLLKLDGSVYTHFNIVVAETVNNFTEFKFLGTFPIRGIDYSFKYSYSGDFLYKLTAEEVFAKYPIYLKARSIASANDYLFYGGPSLFSATNLQKYAKHIKLYWATSAVDEGIYSKAVGTNKFKSFMRDEVYPLAIILEYCHGGESLPIHIPNREATSFDKELVNNSDLLSDIDCENTTLMERWKLYNTASVLQSPKEFTKDCTDPKIWEIGEFAYFESSEKYPNDPEIWGDLCGKPIRYHKFPDSLVTHIHDKKDIILTNHTYNFKEKNIIYPIGVYADAQSIKTFLDIALSDGTITKEEYDSIKGYRIVRGNRAGNKSIIAKGLLYDVWNYSKNGSDYYYPNYPYNDLRADYFIGPDKSVYDGSNTSSPKPSFFNNSQRFTFHSPDIHFVNPTLGSILKLETNEYGSFEGQFQLAEDQAKYKLLSTFSRSISLAYGISTVANLKLIGDFIKGLVLGGIGGVINVALMAGVRTLNEMEVFVNIIRNLSPYLNFGLQYNSVGKYNNYKTIPNDGNKLRRIDKSSYLAPIVQTIDEESSFQTNQFSTILFNNWNRESSVYLKYSGQKLPSPSVQDFSRFTLDSVNFKRGKDSLDNKYYGQVSSYYASIKNYVPNQYGKISSVEYLETDSISKEIAVNSFVLGGDTFITRFALKRKHPFFLQTAFNLPLEQDIRYSELGNVGFPNYYFNSESAIGERLEGNGDLSNLKKFLTQGILGLAPSRLDGKTSKLFYQNGFIHLYSYGIPYFLVESDINTDYRHGENNLEKSFYPVQSDINTWLQEKNVPITEDNYYFYNKVYSKQNKESFIARIPEVITREDLRKDLFNTVIYSERDNLAIIDADNWRIFKANNFYNFPFSQGRLISLDGIANEKILARLENNTSIFNAFDTIETKEGQLQVSTGGIFQSRPKEFALTDLGYAGSQHKSIVNTEYGHVWVDAKRGQVFNLAPGGGGLTEISTAGIRNWLIENLPFQIKNDFPEMSIEDIDNSYKGIGISLGFDKRFSRLLLTKKDYKVLKQGVLYDKENKAFYYLKNGEKIFVKLTNKSYFCDKSWTLSYNFLTKSWISYHSYKPNYYISRLDFFSSGVNGEQSTVWSHGVTNKSYQVFYGKLEPFVIDYTSSQAIANNYISSVEFGLTVLRYHNEFDSFHNQNVTFNKAYVYNSIQNSGLLELIPSDDENLFLVSVYPKRNLDSTTIEVTNSEGIWSFNDFSDIVRSTNNNTPIWLNTCANDNKMLNPLAVDYNKSEWDRGMIRANQNNIRLINDKHSNYKMIYLFSILDQYKSIK